MPDTVLPFQRELLDPQVVELGALAAQAGLMPADPLRQPLAAARDAAERYHVFLNGPALPADVREVGTDGPAGPLRLRLIRSSGALQDGHPRPVLIYFHGGGFVVNSIDTHDRLLRLLARHSDAVVCAVAYSLAPERRFPHQREEALTALRWVVRHGAGYGLDPERIAVGGDSAGANLALGLALDARDEHGPPLSFAMLLYGMFAHDFDTESHRLFGDGRFGLTTERMRWYWQQYLGHGGITRAPGAAPLLGDLRGLPPLHVAAAGLDCLRDDSLRLAQRLEQARIPHRLVLHDGLPHSFASMTRHVRKAEQAVILAADSLRNALRR